MLTHAHLLRVLAVSACALGPAAAHAQQAYFSATGVLTANGGNHDFTYGQIPNATTADDLRFTTHASNGGTNAAGDAIADGPIDSILELRNIGGTPVGSNDDGRTGLDSLLSWPGVAVSGGTLPAGGLPGDDYTLRVRDLGNNSVGQWSVDLEAPASLISLSTNQGSSSSTSGLLDIGSGADLTAQSLSLGNQAGATGSGTVNVAGGGSTLTLTGAEALVLGNSSATSGGYAANVTDAGILTTGTGGVDVNGRLSVGTGGVLRIGNDDVDNDGGSTWTVDVRSALRYGFNGGTPALAIDPGGTLCVVDDGGFRTDGTLINRGTIEIDSNTLKPLDVAGGLTNAGVFRVVADSRFKADTSSGFTQQAGGMLVVERQAVRDNLSGLSLNGDADAAPACATCDRSTGEVTLTIGDFNLAVVGFESFGENLLAPSLAATQAEASAIAFFDPEGLARGTYDLGRVVTAGTAAGDLGFSFTPIGGNSTAFSPGLVPEYGALAGLAALGASFSGGDGRSDSHPTSARVASTRASFPERLRAASHPPRGELPCQATA